MPYRRLLMFVTVSLIMASGLHAQNARKQTAKTDSAVQSDTVLYVCPMHPKVTSSMPGECSKCGMDLVLKKDRPAKKKKSDSMTKQRRSKEGAKVPKTPADSGKGASHRH